jgi:hypothetical protein
MRLLRLLILGAGAAYAYKRFVADAGAGQAETEAAEPFSTENLPDDSPTQEATTPTASASAKEPPSDPLAQPTWLDPADAS